MERSVVHLRDDQPLGRFRCGCGRPPGSARRGGAEEVDAWTVEKQGSSGSRFDPIADPCHRGPGPADACPWPGASGNPGRSRTRSRGQSPPRRPRPRPRRKPSRHGQAAVAPGRSGQASSPPRPEGRCRAFRQLAEEIDGLTRIQDRIQEDLYKIKARTKTPAAPRPWTRSEILETPPENSRTTRMPARPENPRTTRMPARRERRSGMCVLSPRMGAKGRSQGRQPLEDRPIAPIVPAPKERQ